ncbi:neuronal acetylcholine receptor subunit alpha-9-II-like [Uloborus diversus]|uniref:neuronal acetylcholine receptor subunit alpha-9-II-like n=1 Tax=Uloborus diversus TaxID=327109 RepID=UPI00240A7BC4|nr:neuronal acetylcholine receptor subunit alpha-9-II-like [Uloborus diversus]
MAAYQATLHFRIRTNIIMFTFGVLSSLLLIYGVSGSAFGIGDEFLATERDLRRDLFQNYDKLVRPVKNPFTSVNVSVSLSPLQVTDVDDLHQRIVLDTWVLMKWSDDFLKWNLADYDISVLRLPASEIWKPDVALYTGSPDIAMFPLQNTQVLVYNNGEVLWVPPFTIKSRCPMLKTIRKDFIECSIVFGSWTFSENELDLQLLAEQADLSDFLDIHPDWKLVNIVADRKAKTYACCVEKYPSLEYNITMRRRISNFIEPAIFK